MGDSVQVQLFNGVDCELSCCGFNVSSWERVPWNDDIDIPLGEEERAWWYEVKEKLCFNVSIPVWMTKIKEESGEKLIQPHHQELG